jgi:predicted small secreted protein
MIMKRKRLLLAAAVVFCASLGACQSTGGGLAGFGRSPAGVPVAVESIDGPPAPLQTALADELATAATQQQVDLVTDGARYRVRGYVTAGTTPEGEPALAYVWDVFDGEKRRARRLSGSSPLKAASADPAPDPWSGLDRETLARLASDSMAEIASFLVDSKMEVAAGPSAPDAGPALSYAAP